MKIELETSSIAVLISGLYVYYKDIHMYAIPSELFYRLAVILEPYLKDWDYSKQSFEDWIKDELLILPKDLLDNTEEYKENIIYTECVIGRILYVITANIPV